MLLQLRTRTCRRAKILATVYRTVWPRTNSTKNHTVSRWNILTRGGSVIPGLERIFWRGNNDCIIHEQTHLFHCESLNSAKQTIYTWWLFSSYISNILLLSVPWMYMFSLYLPHLMIIFILCNIILLSIPCMYMFCQLYKITPEMWPPLYKGQRVDPEWWPL